MSSPVFSVVAVAQLSLSVYCFLDICWLFCVLFVFLIVIDLFSFLAYHLIFNKRNTTDATSGAETSYPSGAHAFPRF